jgi:hypothetical protein
VGRKDPLGLYPQHVLRVSADGVGIEAEAKVLFEVANETEFRNWLNGIKARFSRNSVTPVLGLAFQSQAPN